MDDKVLLRICSIISYINQVCKDLDGLSLEDLKQSNLLQRAVSFSIAQIGETMTKLEPSLSNRYPDLPWIEARGMRNFIVHDYQSIDIEEVYKTIKDDLPLLKTKLQLIKVEIAKA